MSVTWTGAVAFSCWKKHLRGQQVEQALSAAIGCLMGSSKLESNCNDWGLGRNDGLLLDCFLQNAECNILLCVLPWRVCVFLMSLGNVAWHIIFLFAQSSVYFNLLFFLCVFEFRLSWLQEDIEIIGQKREMLREMKNKLEGWVRSLCASCKYNMSVL